MKKPILILLLSGIAGWSFSQTKNCTEYLQEAQATFDAGNIHDLVDDFATTWGNCLNDELTTFTKEEKVLAYRLLVLTYLQLDEPAKADEYIMKLFVANPEYEPNEAIDPIEFINLYYSYRVKPLFTIGIRGGVNNTFRYIQEPRSLSADTDSPDQQPATFGYQVGASIEFDLFKYNRENRFYDSLIFNPEIYYSNNRTVNKASEDSREGTYTTTFSSLQLNAIGHIYLNNKYKKGNDGVATGIIRTKNAVRILGSFGFTTLFRPSVKNVGSGLNVYESDELSESRVLNHTDAYNRFDVGLIIGAAFRYKVGRPVITLDARYQYYFIPPVKDPSLFQSDMITFGGFYPDEEKHSYPTINVGVHFPIYNHEKLIQK